jgi:hypothetical protein
MRFLLLSILATTTTNVVAFAPFVHHDTVSSDGSVLEIAHGTCVRRMAKS